METGAEQKQRRNQKSRAQRRAAQRERERRAEREQSRDTNAQSRDETKRRRAAEEQIPKPAEFGTKTKKEETLAGRPAGRAPL